MKLTTFFILLTTLQLSASMYSQNARVSLNINNGTLTDLFKEIEIQSEYKVFYKVNQLDLQARLTYSGENMLVGDVLSKVLPENGATFDVVGKVIVITPVTAVQAHTVTGVVTDANGQPLVGVNVVVKGTTRGVITDAKGKYSIEVPDANAVLQFSFIGYLSGEQVVGNQESINISLSEDIKKLEEVIVVGYGTQKKSDVTGAVISVTSKDIASSPVNNAFEAMQGKAAGVDITTTLRPGTIGTIAIRGVRSLTGGNDPLYVVDGVPLMSLSGIETLNPQDIESIDILKDASATAIYGSRGANGVILVTTKRGSSGKLTLNYSGSVTSTSMVWRTRYMNSKEFIDFVRWGSYNQSPTGFTRGDDPSLANDAKITLFNADPTAWANIQKGWASGTWDPSQLESYDWMGEVTQPNFTHEHTLSASGGTEKMKAYASLGYLNNQGTTKGQAYKRYTLRTNVDVTPKKWFQMGTTLNASWENQDYGQGTAGSSMAAGSSLIASAAKVYPYALPYDAQGNLIPFPGGQSRVANIVNEWEYSTDQRQTMRIMGTLFAEVKLFDGLKYHINFGPDYRNYRDGIYNDGKSVTRGGSSYASYGGNSDFSWTLDNLLYYDKTLGVHKFGVTLLQTASSWKQERYAMNAQGIALASQQWYAMGTVSALDSWNSGLTERQLSSYMGRLNYSFADKYLLTVSGRWDGASVLAEGHKWAFFPSVALGWRMDQEGFLKDIDWLSQMKLRLGYGATGNAAVQPYSTKGGIILNQTPFGSSIVNGYTTGDTVSNPLLGWERTTQYNLGIDFSIFKGRVNGVVDLYVSNTTDLLMTMLLPSVSGYKATIANVGKTRNKGIDITLNTINVKIKDFVWDSRISAAWQKDEIVSLMNGKEDMIGSGPDGGFFIGKSIRSIYDYQRLGLWQDTPEDQAEMAKFNANGQKFQPGMIKVKDQNGDYKIDANNDKVVLGNIRPRWTVGLNNNFTYKNWQLSVFVTGRLKYSVNVGESLTGMYGDQRVLDYWTPNNTGAEYQKPFRNEAAGDTYSGTYYKDDSYLKIRSISLGYDLPKNIVTKLKINNLKLSVQSTNPGMLWSNNKFRDAEYGSIYYNRGLVFRVDVGF